jgi:Sec1 family
MSFTPLRSYAKHRILNDMLDVTRRHATPASRDYLILVLDASALRVFSSCCRQFFEVYQRAGIYQMERLEYKRKRYSHTDAIYFVAPTQESVNYILSDFSDESKKAV